MNTAEVVAAPNAPGEICPTSVEPIWLITCARSGSTLLRYMLDAHADIACPPETNIAGMAEMVARVWYILCADQSGDFPDEPSPDVRESILQAVRAPMVHFCEAQGKRWYCDKSLDTLLHAASVSDLFPDSRYILLFRNVMDVVASGLEASPWGFNAYGFEPFVRQSPHNLVAALVQYWNVHVHRALEWEDEHPELCLRVRYEDLVARPHEELTRIYHFLAIEPDFSVIDRAFRKPRLYTAGPGDHKVVYTDRIHTDSVDRGRTIPVTMIPAPLLDATNEHLQRLGYDQLTPAWNSVVPAFTPESLENVTTTAWVEMLASLLGDHDELRVDAMPAGIDSIAIVALDTPGLRWTLGATQIATENAHAASVTMIGSAESWVKLITGEANAGTLFRSGLIRCTDAPDESNVPEAMPAIVELIKKSVQVQAVAAASRC